MANVLFKRGTQAELNALITASKIKDGAFYLTTDTHRLYSGSAATKVDLLSQAVVTVNSLNDLNRTGAKVDGQFYYSIAENVLCIYSSKDNKYIQINPDSYTYVNDVNLVVEQIGTNGATLKNSITMNSKGTTDIGDGKVVEDTTPVKLVGSGSVKVTVDGSQSSGPVITIDGIEYGIAGSAKEAGKNAKLTVGKQSVNIVGEGATKVAYKNNEVVISSTDTDYHIQDVKVTPKPAGEGGGFDISVTDQSGGTDADTIDPIVKLGTNTDQYHFIDGVMNLPVFTKDEVIEKFNVANAMTYIGLVQGSSANHSAPTNGIHIGDTYKVAGGYISVVDGNNNSVTAQVGDVIIARGTEYTLDEAKAANDLSLAGTIKPNTLKWDVIHAADFVTNDRMYNILGNTTENGFDLIKDGAPVSTVKFKNDSHITAKATADNDKITSITIKHNTITQNNPNNDAEIVQVQGNPATYEAIVGVNVDDAGHVTGVKKQSLTVKDTTLADGSMENTLTTTATSGKTNSVDVKSEVGVTDTADKHVVKSDTMVFNSPNNSIAITAGAKTVSFDLVWGSFTD